MYSRIRRIRPLITSLATAALLGLITPQLGQTQPSLSLPPLAPIALTQVRGSQVGLVLPPGFSPAERFAGFVSEADQASILVTDLPASYQDMTQGFTAERLSQRGLTLLSREPAQFGGMQGEILGVTQSAAGKTYFKWIGVFGSQKQVYIVTATLPQERQQELSAQLKQAVLSARIITTAADPLAALGFTITPSPDLRVARVVNNLVLLTKDGVLPARNPAGPVMVVGPSLSENLLVANRREFSLQRLQQTQSLKEIRASSIESITLDGLSGYEIVAEGLDKQTGQPMTLYQVLLFGLTDYYILQGIVANLNRERYLTLFKSTASSFKRRPN